MAVAVQGSRRPIQQEDVIDPVERILKGLEIASNIYKVKEAKTEVEKIKAEAKKEKETSQNIDLASKGLKLQDGKVVEDPESSVFKARLLKTEPKEINPTVKALRDITLQAKVQELEEKTKKAEFDKTTEGKIQKLGADAKKRYDDNIMAAEAVNGMAAALDKGNNTFSVFGQNDFTRNRAKFKEAFGRMQSGGAIGIPEGKDFEDFAPSLTDTKEQAREKLLDFQRILSGRSKTLGFTPEETGVVPLSFKYGSKEKPKEEFKVLQNGKKLKKVPGGWEEVE